ncbi:hypothetical protein ACQP3J_26950, partial [Escherichia coli]
IIICMRERLGITGLLMQKGGSAHQVIWQGCYDLQTHHVKALDLMMLISEALIVFVCVSWVSVLSYL